MYCFISALTISVQEFFQRVVFNCPCEGYFEYGLAFLLGPAVLLFLPRVFLDDTLCRTGPERNTAKAMSSLLCRYANQVTVHYILCNYTSKHRLSCLIGSISLAAEVLHLRTLATDRCRHFPLGVRSKEMEESYKTRSQFAGWSLMIIFILILITCVCIRRCLKKGKRLRIPRIEH